jgi:hypothetical protein
LQGNLGLATREISRRELKTNISSPFDIGLTVLGERRPIGGSACGQQTCEQ